jgi:hypothetical protein
MPGEDQEKGEEKEEYGREKPGSGEAVKILVDAFLERGTNNGQAAHGHLGTDLPGKDSDARGSSREEGGKREEGDDHSHTYASSSHVTIQQHLPSSLMVPVNHQGVPCIE